MLLPKSYINQNWIIATALSISWRLLLWLVTQSVCSTHDEAFEVAPCQNTEENLSCFQICLASANTDMVIGILYLVPPYFLPAIEEHFFFQKRMPAEKYGPPDLWGGLLFTSFYVYGQWCTEREVSPINSICAPHYSLDPLRERVCTFRLIIFAQEYWSMEFSPNGIFAHTFLPVGILAQ